MTTQAKKVGFTQDKSQLEYLWKSNNSPQPSS